MILSAAHVGTKLATLRTSNVRRFDVENLVGVTRESQQPIIRVCGCWPIVGQILKPLPLARIFPDKKTS